MKLDKRRRIENKTNYRKRLVLLKSDSLRLVIRKTNKYLNLQIVKSEDAKDSVLHSVSSKDLLKSGWPETKKGSLKSLTASYLTGLLLGKNAKGIKERVVLDTGLAPSTKGSRIYAAVKGISDAGLKINYDKEIIPSQERIEGKGTELESVFKKLKGALI